MYCLKRGIQYTFKRLLQLLVNVYLLKKNYNGFSFIFNQFKFFYFLKNIFH